MKAEHDALVKEEKVRKELETNNVKLLQEKNDLFLQLEAERAGFGDLEERLNKALAQKADLQTQLTVRSIFFLLQYVFIKKKCNRIFKFF